MKLATALVLAAALSSPAAQTRTATIEGVVTKAGANEPLSETTVVLGLASDGSPRSTAITDSAGRFVFSDVAPGTYHVSASRAGYLPSEPRQLINPGRGIVLTIAAGQQLRDARLELIETGAISGRILDRNGQPFPNVQVQALRYGYEDGKRVLKTTRAVATDDLGQYRIFWLPPGDYVILAKPLRGGLTNQLIDMMPGGGTAMRMFSEPTGELILAPDSEGSIPLFFPGTTTGQKATPIEVRAGANIRGIDLTFTPIPAYHVRGVVTGMPASNDRSGFPSIRVAGMEMQEESALDSRSLPRLMANIDPVTGAFDFSGVAPGSYFVSASATVNIGNNSTTVRARVPLEVVSSDISNLSLPLTAPAEVQGMLSVEGGPAGGASPSPGRMYIRLRPDVAGAAPQATGNFVLRGVRSGNYQVSVSQLPEGAYLKSVRLADTEILDSGLRVNAEPLPPLTIVVSMRAASITAAAIDAQGKPVPDALVALVPDAPRRGRLDLYKNGFADASGKVEIKGVAPGGYKAFAWRQVEDGAWLNGEFIARFEDIGKPVRVEEGANATVEVTLP